MNGLHELPLILFTVLAQSAVGAFLVFGWALYQQNSVQSKQYIHKVMFVLLALLGVGFLCSITHLGSPLRAFNSLNRVGSSMLSNEIASGALFFALAGGYWLLNMLNKLPEHIGKIWLAITLLVGLVFMYMMANLYRIETVPTWNTGLTSAIFYLTVVVGGCALAYPLLQANQHKTYRLNWLPYVYLFGVICVAIVIVYQGSDLANIKSSAQQARLLVPDYAPLMAIRLALLGIAFILFLRTQKIALLVLAGLFVLFGEFIGRTIFYAMHMTVGTAFGA